MVILKEFFEKKVYFGKYKQTQKHAKLPRKHGVISVYKRLQTFPSGNSHQKGKMDDVKVSEVINHQRTNSNRLSKKRNQALQGQSGIIDHIHLYSSTL